MKWTDEEKRIVAEMYSDHCASEIAERLGRSVSGVYCQARAMGLKSPREKIVRLGKIGASHPKAVASKFQKGHVPENKGKKMKALDLVLKKKWYDMIASGEKTEEYREIKPYWANRILYHIPLGIREYWQNVLDGAFTFLKDNPGRFDLHNLLVRNYGTRGYTHVTFHLGYAKNRPSMTFKIKDIVISRGKQEWGAVYGEYYFVIKLGERHESKS